MVERDKADLSKVKFEFEYSGPALEAGLMDVRDLAPALLALGDLYQKANYQVNGDKSKVSVQIRAFRQGSFLVEFAVAISFLGMLGLSPIKAATEVFGLVNKAIEFAKLIKGEKVRNVTRLENDVTRLSLEHNHTIDVSDRLYDLIKHKSAQEDVRRIVAPLRNEGVESLRILRDGRTTQSVRAEDIPDFDALPSAFPNELDLLQDEPSIIEKSFRVVSVSSDAHYPWRFQDESTIYPIKVDDKRFYERAKEGRLGIEPGFIVRARIRSEYRGPGEKPESHLLEILSVKPPEPRDDGTSTLF